MAPFTTGAARLAVPAVRSVVLESSYRPSGLAQWHGPSIPSRHSSAFGTSRQAVRAVWTIHIHHGCMAAPWSKHTVSRLRWYVRAPAVHSPAIAGRRAGVVETWSGAKVVTRALTSRNGKGVTILLSNTQ